MDHDDTALQQSVTERQLQRLVVRAPAAYDPSERINFLHDRDLDLLWGAE